MTDKLYLNKEFYKRLAHLFYAFAAADRKIMMDEKRRIVKETECFWAYKTHAFNAKTIINETMRETIFGEWDKNHAFDSFSAFYQENKNDFSQEIKLKIKNSANAIISAFAGANKAELTMLSQLHLLFQEEIK